MSPRRRSALVGLDAVLPSAALALMVISSMDVAHAAGDEPERQARWEDVSTAIFGDRPIGPADGLVMIEAPSRAMEAALVPVTLRVTRKEGVRALHLVIDENPSPYAANVRFGPAGDPSELRLRVRINGYTNVHAVAEMDDGKLYETSVFVKAAGGCSAPIGVTDEEAMAGMGEMRMKFTDEPGHGIATLMIRHPNFSGMQMNQVTRNYTPARFLDDIKVSYEGQTVFELNGDISMSTDPVIGFAYTGPEAGEFQVQAADSSGGQWQGSFPVAGSTN